VSEKGWHLDVGSDVVRDEFFADVWYGGRHWASVVERDGSYQLVVMPNDEPVEVELEAALESLGEARRRIALPK